jgi:hypothetical protein
MSLIVVGPYTTLVPSAQRGFSVPFCRRQTGRWSPTNGWTLDQEFNSLSLSAMENLSAIYQNAGIEYEITFQNGIATMRTVDTTGTITIDVWEITASRISETVFGSPKVIAEVSTNDLKVLARAYRKQITPAAAVKEMNTTTPAPSTKYTEPDTTVDGPTKRLYEKVFNSDGDEATFLLDQYSLRHTTNASNRGFFNVADVNVNRIYTQAQFFSEIKDAGFWIFPAPLEIIGALVTIFNGIGTPLANRVTGALKGGSSRITAAGNRVNIVTEYLLAQIDTDNYFMAE